MTWFEFGQNNSGGRWCKPAIRVVVEANDENAAVRVAEARGVDESAPFCPCCGERWSLSFPSQHENKPGLHELFGGWEEESLYKGRGIPRALYVSADGAEEVVE